MTIKQCSNQDHLKGENDEQGNTKLEIFIFYQNI